MHITHNYALTTNNNLSSNNRNFEVLQTHEHALIGVSTFNSYFSQENMEKLFCWAQQSFNNFNVCVMDEASIFNLMAMGYDKKEALKKTKRNDKYLYNKIIRSLTSLGFSLDQSQRKILHYSYLSKSTPYLKIYNKCVNLFNNNVNYTNDCLNATKLMLADKVNNLDEDKLDLAVKYLLAELPFWYDTPYILGINSSTFIYKDLSFYWQRICYNYDLLSKKQSIYIKNVCS